MGETTPEFIADDSLEVIKRELGKHIPADGKRVYLRGLTLVFPKPTNVDMIIGSSLRDFRGLIRCSTDEMIVGKYSQGEAKAEIFEVEVNAIKFHCAKKLV